MGLLRGPLIFALVLTFLCTSTARAQSVDSKWEVEFHAGGAFPIASSQGDTALPPFNSIASAPILDSARIVSSWYFGDGPAQFNSATSSILVFAPIVPLDGMLQARLGERQAGAAVGFRVSRILTERFAAEFSFDAADTSLAISAASLTGIEVSRLSYEYAWNSFLASPSGRAQTVSSVAKIEDHRGRQFTTAGALIVNVAKRERLTPYVAIGAGAVTNTGGTPSAQLTGNYAFVFPPTFVALPPGLPIVTVNDVDAVAIHTVADNRFVLALGGGFKFAAGRRLGIRVDVRDYLGQDTQKTLLDATPTRAPSPSSLTTGAGPRITFGSSAFARATLSGPNISNFETYSATGSEHDVHLTAGVYWRF